MRNFIKKKINFFRLKKSKKPKTPVKYVKKASTTSQPTGKGPGKLKQRMIQLMNSNK